jgi:spore coat protein U-like protein
VTVTLSSSCSVSAASLSFGNVGVLNANVDAATNVSVTCTYTTPYQVQLSAGAAPGATTTSRAMTNGAAEVFYGLYQNAGRSTNWGSNLGVDTVSGTGTGSAQSIPVYGRIPPQTTPTIGTYSDTVVVTVNY